MLFFDKATIADESKRTITPEGYIVVPAVIARVGLQSYTVDELTRGMDSIPDAVKNKDGSEILKVYRPESEVFNPDSMQSFTGKPLTNNHPPEDVTIDNIKKYQVGYSGDIADRDGNTLKLNKLTFTDKNTIAQIRDGKSELSNGYAANLVFEAGTTPDGDDYDVMQTDIRGNHIALVEMGRAGYDCRIADTKPKTGDKTMKTFIVDGVTFEASEQVCAVISKLQDGIKQANTKLTDEGKAQKAEMDKLQAKLDDAKSKILDDKAIEQRVSVRANLIADAGKLVDGFDATGKSNIQILSAVVDAKCKIEDIANKSEDYLQARFDALLADEDKKADGSDDKKADIDDEDEDDDKDKKTKIGDSADAAYQKRLEETENAWKKGDK